MIPEGAPAPLKQDISAVLDYKVDWSKHLVPRSDTIQTSTWEVTPAGLQIHDETLTNTSAVVWLKGGQLGEMYTITNHIVTSQGREDHRTFFLKITER